MLYYRNVAVAASLPHDINNWRQRRIRGRGMSHHEALGAGAPVGTAPKGHTPHTATLSRRMGHTEPKNGTHLTRKMVHTESPNGAHLSIRTGHTNERSRKTRHRTLSLQIGHTEPPHLRVSTYSPNGSHRADEWGTPSRRMGHTEKSIFLGGGL